MAAAAKNSAKVASSKKSSKAAAAAPAVVAESPARISRRAAPAKAAAKASPSPSPAPKASKKKPAAVAKKSKKEVESEAEAEEPEAVVAKTVPLVSSKSCSTTSSCSSSSSSCCKKMIRGYLIIYNSVSALAWAFLLFNLAKSFFVDQPHNHQVLFGKTGMYLAYLQTAALLEVLHAALGWVRSGVISNVIQIASRLFVIWVAGVFGGTGKHWAYAMMSVAWSLSDLTRYAYYLTQLTGCSSCCLKWARYNFFLILYPVGTLGEAILIFLARLKWSKDLFLSYGLLTVLAIYTPGFLYMYSHMLHQRAKHFACEPCQEQTATVAPSKSRKTKSKQ